MGNCNSKLCKTVTVTINSKIGLIQLARGRVKSSEIRHYVNVYSPNSLKLDDVDVVFNDGHIEKITSVYNLGENKSRGNGNIFERKLSKKKFNRNGY